MPASPSTPLDPAPGDPGRGTGPGRGAGYAEPDDTGRLPLLDRQEVDRVTDGPHTEDDDRAGVDAPEVARTGDLPEVPPPAAPVGAEEDADGPPLTARPGALGAEATGEAPRDTPTGAPRTRRAGRDMVAAISVGLGLGAVVLATLFLYRPAFLVVIALAVVISITELTRALDAGGHRAPLPPVLVGGLLMIGLAWTRGSAGLVVGFLLTVFAVLLWRLGDGPSGYLRDASAAVFVALYVPLLAGFAVLLLVPDDGVARVLAFIVTVVCSDVGGFAAGVAFGKHPLAPSVSPKKSWEGLAGSVAACVLAGVLLMTLTFHGPWWGGVAFGVAMALTATLGDLGESLLKRDLGIKDMGTLLPGHGGLMDRMDSLLPAAVVSYLLLSAIVPA